MLAKLKIIKSNFITSKWVFYFFVFILLVVNNLSAQTWIELNSPTSNKLTDINFIDDQQGWAVGWYNTAIRTTNGGANWSTLTTGKSQWWEDVCFVNNSTGWIVGYSGDILKTINGGLTWNQQESGFNDAYADLYGVDFVDQNNGWAASAGIVGEGYYILHTSNGGTDWEAQPTNEGMIFLDISFANSNLGLAVGPPGEIYRTDNGGISWTAQDISTNLTIRAVHFLKNTQKAWAVGDNGTILYTDNGGLSWSNQQAPTTNQLLGVSFHDTNHGWAVGHPGIIHKTTNGGVTWSSETSPTSFTLTSVCAIDNDISFACGNDGVIIKRTILPPDPPSLISPTNGSTNQSLTLTLDWTDSDNATNYDVQVSLNSSFTSLVVDEDGLSSSQYTIPAEILSQNTTFYWHANASNKGGTSNWSSYRNFRTILYPPDPPNLLSPTNGSTNQSLNLTLDWTNSANATEYGVQVSTNSSFTSLVVDENGLSSSQHKIPAGLLSQNTTYYWWANASNSSGTSDWSNYWNFTTLQANINITTPNGGENWEAGSSQTIKWTSINVISVDIDYSINNGASWVPIATNYTSTGQRPWITPSTPSTQCLVKISDSDNPNILDISNSTFTILTPSGLDGFNNEIPLQFSLYQNFPNPFNPLTTIRYSLPKLQHVILEIYDLGGKEIKTLVNSTQVAGHYGVQLDGSDLSSGVYYYIIRTEDFKGAKKLLLLK
jgi:photosystem II stability/assembly factor-like uncharacterized protein